MRKLLISSITALAAAAFVIPAAFAAAGGDTAERMAKTCAGCHGTYGASPGETIPSIGGQNEDYLKKVMAEFKDGSRKYSVEMSLSSKAYTSEQLDAISEWYADKKWHNSQQNTPEFNMEATVTLVENYGCFGCHTDSGKGGGTTPAIAGQNMGYLKEVLMKYKDGAIASDEMSIVKEISEVEIDSIAAYLTLLGRSK
jgi:sulfide dehydrogenase cytochrome subunit